MKRLSPQCGQVFLYRLKIYAAKGGVELAVHLDHIQSVAFRQFTRVTHCGTVHNVEYDFLFKAGHRLLVQHGLDVLQI